MTLDHTQNALAAFRVQFASSEYYALGEIFKLHCLKYVKLHRV